VKKLTLTTTALTAIAGSALLTGIAFAEDSMRTSDASAGRSPIAVLARSTDAEGAAKGALISAAAKAMNDDRAADRDKDEDVDNDEAVDNDNDENEVDADNDENDEVEVDNDDRGTAVSAVASTNRHGDKHSGHGR
jgi:hypothetical protein